MSVCVGGGGGGGGGVYYLSYVIELDNYFSIPVLSRIPLQR